ncbi:hypothetical protein ACB098_02G130700 [Castanea mollissima]
MQVQTHTPKKNKNKKFPVRLTSHEIKSWALTNLGFPETLISILANVLGLAHFLNKQKHSIDQNSSVSSSCFWHKQVKQKLPWKNTKRMELTIRLSYIGTCFSPTSSSPFF